MKQLFKEGQDNYFFSAKEINCGNGSSKKVCYLYQGLP